MNMIKSNSERSFLSKTERAAVKPSNQSGKKRSRSCDKRSDPPRREKSRRRYKPLERPPYYILRIDNVPTRVSFHKMLNMMSPYSRHIVGIGRTADYNMRRLGLTIYVYCTRKEDALFLEKQELQLVDDGRPPHSLSMVELTVGCASLEDRLPSLRYRNVPIPVRISGLPRYKDEVEGYTEYLMSLAANFELDGVVTSIRLNYDPNRKCTKTDGFITYLNERDAREVAEEDKPKHLIIFGQDIHAVMSTNIPVLVLNSSSTLLTNGRAKWSTEIQIANRLIAVQESPFTTNAISQQANRTSLQSSTTAPIISVPSDPNCDSIPTRDCDKQVGSAARADPKAKVTKPPPKKSALPKESDIRPSNKSTGAIPKRVIEVSASRSKRVPSIVVVPTARVGTDNKDTGSVKKHRAATSSSSSQHSHIQPKRPSASTSTDISKLETLKTPKFIPERELTVTTSYKLPNTGAKDKNRVTSTARTQGTPISVRPNNKEDNGINLSTAAAHELRHSTFRLAKKAQEPTPKKACSSNRNVYNLEIVKPLTHPNPNDAPSPAYSSGSASPSDGRLFIDEPINFTDDEENGL